MAMKGQSLMIFSELLEWMTLSFIYRRRISGRDEAFVDQEAVNKLDAPIYKPQQQINTQLFGVIKELFLIIHCFMGLSCR